MKNSTSPIIIRRPKAELILYLIIEELKSLKFFNALQQMGLDGCYFRPRLYMLILRTLNVNEDSDVMFDAYCEIMERRSLKIDEDDDSVMKQALKAYDELLDLKQKINARIIETDIS